MRLQLTKQILAAAAVLAILSPAGNVFAQEGSFIVGSQVVSDTVSAASGGYVGDIAHGSISDGCENGDCGSATCGRCGAGGGLLGKLCNADGSGTCEPRQYDHSDLFYNFYSGGNCNTANAQMYVSPLPVPQSVGHTFYTYQPLYPHELMYAHKDRYHNVYDNGRGMNRTKVHYSYPPVKTAISNIYWNKLRLPR